jgi:methionyl-tRNA synthetase
MKKEKVLITSALPYANGPLHFGHIAGAYLPGDCYARFQRLCQKDVLYVCGSDEYGVAITLSAEVSKRTPKEHVDTFHRINKNLFNLLNFSFDHYSRTTCEGHKEVAQEFFLTLLNNKLIEARETEQLYSSEDNRFLADRYVIGICPKCGFDEARGDECPKCAASFDATDLKEPRSKLTNAPLSLKKTKHWFLLLDKLKEPLQEWIQKKNWKPNVSKFVLNYIDDLRPRAITRDLEWGVPVPLKEAEGKVLYVWFDAPIGYISASMEWAKLKGNPDLWKEFWLEPSTKLVNFIGKDNIPFHSVIFPAMVMGQDKPFKLVDELPANEFLTLEGKQFSKSDGWTIDLQRFFDRYTSDQIRYTLAANAPETGDSEFSWKDFQQRCNTELLGKFGNLVNRTLIFARNNCAYTIPAKKEAQAIDEEFLAQIKDLVTASQAAYSSFKLRKASQIIMELAQLGNVYFDRKKPWVDAKTEEGRSTMETTIACCLECLKTLALLSFPIIPETAQKLWNLLGYTHSIQEQSWESIIDHFVPEGQVLPAPSPLFRKIEDEEIQQELDNLKAMNKAAKIVKKTEDRKELITFEDFSKIELRVAQVVEAKKVPKSKKLLELKVDLGCEKRTIVSGIHPHYNPETIIGKKVMILTNLKPTKIMGIQSEGMLLVGSTNSEMEIPSFDRLPLGSIIS